MKSFIKKTLVFFIPVYLPIIMFIIIDPFMLFFGKRGDIKLKDEYSILNNRDFQSTELFNRNYKDFHYNSFIFGNSRSFFFNINSWKNHINGICFHFNSSAETIFGIEGKLRFLHEKDVPIKNALIVLDYGTLFYTENSKGHLFIKHPSISNESIIKFYQEMYSGFFPKAIIAHSHLFLAGKRKNYMSKYGIRDNVWKLDKNNNQLEYYVYDSIIKVDIEQFYNDRENYFPKRDTIEIVYDAVIKRKQKELLKSIKNILTIQNTNYKIVINPLYEQIKLNSKDLDYLNSLFGESNVFDFSGINDITNSIYNYYETSHYRPVVADEMLQIMYTE